MFRKLLAGLMLALSVAAMTPAAEAGRGFVVSNRIVRSYQRDVRQFQRQTSRSFSQLNRNFSRSVRRAPRVRSFTPRSSGIYFGGRSGGVFIGF